MMAEQLLLARQCWSPSEEKGRLLCPHVIHSWWGTDSKAVGCRQCRVGSGAWGEGLPKVMIPVLRRNRIFKEEQQLTG